MPLRSGTRLGTYEIVGPLGAGGMGEVYRAKDLRLGREVAVKVLPAEVASSPDRLARFEREARTVAALNHPNIVTLFSVEDEDDVRFLTMELVEGQTLATLVTPGGLPLARVLDLSIPLADALAAAHEKGVVHRDLKPGNVMVTRGGRVKVLDFGLAKLAARDEDADPTRATTVDAALSDLGQVVGTVPYMAPEQIRGDNADARSDVFALGIMIYELATGRRPFCGETPADLISAILRDAPVPLTRTRADLPAALEHLVNRCLEKSPRRRLQTALDLSNELRAIRRFAERGPQHPAAPGSVASIAVLPFVNRSASAEDEYFSDGLADELIGLLAKIKGLRVSARASSFQFKGQNVDLPSIGAQLNVATVLDGSVRKARDRVRISVQLVKVADGYHLWSETYDRKLDDIFAVQDDIAGCVVKELRTTLLGEEAGSDASGRTRAEVARAAKGRGSDPEAHRLYLLARHLVERWTRPDSERAIGYLEEAVKRDPDFAFAWTELARAFTFAAGQGWIPVASGYARARAAVERALTLEPELAEAHAALESIQSLHDWDWQGADRSIRLALDLAPGSAEVLRRAGYMAWIHCRFDDALVFYRRALEQDPLSSAAYHGLGRTCHSAGRLAEAEDASRKALELAPERASTRALLALVLLDLGRTEEALETASREPEESWRLFAESIVRFAQGHAAESDELLRQYVEKHAESDAVQIAEVYAMRGQRERAFEWLERARAQRDGGVSGVRPSPWLRSLHGDPRWNQFLRRLGLWE